jgi:hypothetical protein
MPRSFTTFIPDSDCIGDSLNTINTSYLKLDEECQRLDTYDNTLRAAITPSGNNLTVANNLTVTNIATTNTLTVTNNLTATGGNVKLQTGRIIRQIMVESDTTGRAIPAAWTLGPVFTTMTGCKAGSLIRLSYYVPARNDGNSWGGLYIEPQISFNNGAGYFSLGSTGHSLVMESYASIATLFNQLLIDPNQTSDFSVKFRFYYLCYNDANTTVNSGNAINNISSTATLGLLPNTAINNQNQHYTKIIVEELY